MIKFYIELDFDIEKKIYSKYEYDWLQGHRIAYTNKKNFSFKSKKNKLKVVSEFDADVICKFMLKQQEKKNAKVFR